MESLQGSAENNSVEASLQEYKDRYDYATSVGKVGIWDWDPSTGKLYWNDEVYVLLGLSGRKIEPTFELFMSMVHAEDREVFKAAVEEALQNKRPFNTEYRVLHNDGSERVFHAIGKVTFDEAEKPVRMMGTFQDITDRSITEQRLDNIIQELETLLETAPVAILHAKYFEIMKVNRRFVEMFGFSNDEIAGKRTQDLYPQQWRPDEAEIRNIEQVISSGLILEKEALFARKDGSTFWGRLLAKPIRENDPLLDAIITIEDITEKRGAEEALRAAKENAESASAKLKASEARFRQLAEAGFEMIAIHHQGVILDINQQVQDMLGYEKSEITGKNIFSFVAPETRETAMKTFAERSEEMIELTLVKKDGGHIFVESRARTIEYAGKEARIVIVRDVTARKKNEAKLRAAKEEAEMATKLKDNFVSLVSHDLRSPLANINSLTRIFKQHDMYKLDDAKRAQILDKVIDNSAGLLILIDKLLDLSRLKTGRIKVEKRFLSAYGLAETCISFMAFNAEAKGVMIRNEIPRTHRIFADEALFGEVLQNLVSNAIKFCRGGDSIAIFVSPEEPDIVAVRDTGVGMKPETLSSVFTGNLDAPAKGTGGEKGTGLGLQYCREIMSAHGGSIRAESAPDKGTTFYLTLPGQKASVMLVDDVQAQREIMKDMLADTSGLNILEAENGQEALDIMRRALPHLIITDLSMPVMDGFRLIREVKRSKLFDGVPVIAITSVTSSGAETSEVDIRNRVFSLGADDFVTKPFTKGDFLPRVQRFLGF
ncbi:MAG: PAS domain S-box protein [Nitrospinota bacterium]|nr:PAS domain S-box protein [Nitrospinota bacterium]